MIHQLFFSLFFHHIIYDESNEVSLLFFLSSSTHPFFPIAPMRQYQSTLKVRFPTMADTSLWNSRAVSSRIAVPWSTLNIWRYASRTRTKTRTTTRTRTAKLKTIKTMKTITPMAEEGYFHQALRGTPSRRLVAKNAAGQVNKPCPSRASSLICWE